jgi:hypothetical protein
MFTVLVTFMLLSGAGFVLHVSCVQIGNWNVELLGVGGVSKDGIEQAIANLTSNITIESVELSYTFAGQNQPINVSMTLLNSSSWHGSTSTLWSAEFSTPGANFTLTEQFYVRNTLGNVATFQNSFSVSELTGSGYESLLSPPMILFLCIIVAILISLLIYSRHHKIVAENPSVAPPHS